MDSTAKTQLASPAFAVAWFIFLDVSGDPVRITTLGKNFTFSSTGDSDLDGNTFNAFDGRAIDIGSVAQSESGSDTKTITLSGIVSLDSTLLNEIGNRALWQGRECRTWFAIYDPDGVNQQGAIVADYTGYMTAVDINDSPEAQTIMLSVENWRSAFNQASNRSYFNQKDYDSADTSAAATVAAANGAKNHGVATVGSGSGGGGAGGGHSGGRVLRV